ncbi:MAG: putative toxin-antitoxin system toxin component, PIN family [Paludibacteraceae bacterium]|nr:putative toxin-antitoxin system toxin component, PIN family [Paludibacteraceae bacterium]MBQ7996562.1 putative toxin-antitoxin system toxin component, PIN family [Paludibacteraceae bacterium]
MKIVLDTNCLVNVIMPNSYNNDIWQAFRAFKYTLCISNEILLEYHEILTKRYNVVIANTIVKELLESPNVQKITPAYRFCLITADPDDNKFVDCAITAGATFIVSNDKHFKELDNYDYPKVDVRRLEEFLQIVRKL